MGISDTMDLVNEAEKRFPVDLWTIGTVHIWPLVRLPLVFSINQLPFAENDKVDTHRFSVLMGRMIRILRTYIRYSYSSLLDLKNNDWPRNKKDAVFYSDGISFTLINHRWYDRYCDPLIARFNENGKNSFMITPVREFLVPRNTPSFFIQPYMDYLRIKRLFVLRETYGENLPAWGDFLNFLDERGFSHVIPGLNKLRKQVEEIVQCTQFYLRLFRRLRPKIAFIVSYYSLQGMAFIRACREYGIPSVDIQHGAQGDLHGAYGQWNKVPKEGFDLLPSIFLCWGESEARAIRKWNRDCAQYHRPLIVGNLFLDLWKSGGNCLTAPYDLRIAEIKRQLPKAIHVLYTLNGESIEERKRLSYILETSESSHLPLFFWVRLHPSQLNQKGDIIRFLKEKNISNFEASFSSELPLYALLRHVDIHITEFSSTAQEAIHFGVPSVIMSRHGAEFFAYLVSSGWALPAYESKEVIDAIHRQLRKRESLRKSQINTESPSEKGFSVLLSMIDSEHRVGLL